MQIIKSAPHVALGISLRQPPQCSPVSRCVPAQTFCRLTVVAFVRFALLYQCKFTSSFEIRIRNLLNVSEISERQSAPHRGCKGQHIALLRVFAQIKNLQLEKKKQKCKQKVSQMLLLLLCFLFDFLPSNSIRKYLATLDER